MEVLSVFVGLTGDVVDLLTRFALSHCHEARSALNLGPIQFEGTTMPGPKENIYIFHP